MNAVVDFRLAVKDDLSSVYELNDRFNLKNISDADHKFGFVTNTYSTDELALVIAAGDMVVMTHDNVITGCLYVINALPFSEILQFRWQRLLEESKVSAQDKPGLGSRIIINKEKRHYRYPAELFLKFFELNGDRYNCLFSGINKQNDVSLKTLVKA